MKKVISIDKSNKAAPWTQLAFNFPDYWWIIEQLVLGSQSDIVDYDEENGVLNVTLSAYKLSWNHTDDWKPILDRFQVLVSRNLINGSPFLSPFTYSKSILKKWRGNALNSSNMKNDNTWSLREWYIPLCVTEIPVCRWPNHVHELDYGLFCIVSINDKRETRFFPKNSIPEWTRIQAKKLLNNEQTKDI